MNGERNTDRNVRKFIRILDMEIWDKIDEIMTLPEYEKSFNKLINIRIPNFYVIFYFKHENIKICKLQYRINA